MVVNGCLGDSGKPVADGIASLPFERTERMNGITVDNERERFPHGLRCVGGTTRYVSARVLLTSIIPQNKMPSLSDHIDRLAANTRKISAAAHRASISSSCPGLFAGAILLTHLGDLIRDADPSELGLFSLVHPERVAVQDKPVEIERINFHGATPLRKSYARHDDALRARDPDPELYAEAAMKYMDR